MINDGLNLSTSSVLCYDSTGDFKNPLGMTYYDMVTYPVSMDKALDGGIGAEFKYILRPVTMSVVPAPPPLETEHRHVSSGELIRTAHCWRRVDANLLLHPI